MRQRIKTEILKYIAATYPGFPIAQEAWDNDEPVMLSGVDLCKLVEHVMASSPGANKDLEKEIDEFLRRGMCTSASLRKFFEEEIDLMLNGRPKQKPVGLINATSKKG